MAITEIITIAFTDLVGTWPEPARFTSGCGRRITGPHAVELGPDAAGPLGPGRRRADGEAGPVGPHRGSPARIRHS